jgi:predicted MarR family transcription regulator
MSLSPILVKYETIDVSKGKIVMIDVEYIKPREFKFCDECGKLMGNCEHTKSSTYNIKWMTKAELVAQSENKKEE